MFPRPAEELHIDQSAYQHLWTQFHRESQELLPGDWLGLFHLLQKYAWAVPSSARRGEIRDTSLFNHLWVTAAIAACLEAQGCDEHFLRNLRNPDARERGDLLFLLLKGDISGIQRFLYTLTSKGAAKGLRGRSAYLQLLTDAVASWLLERLGLPFVNVLFIGGGHFLLLLPYKAEGELETLQRQVTASLLRGHGTDLYLALGWTPLCARDFAPETFGEKWAEAGRAANRAKQRRFSELDRDALLALLEPQGEGGKRRSCDICQTEEADDFSLAEDEDGNLKCPLCLSFERLGNDVAHARYLLVETDLPDEHHSNSMRGWQDVLILFGHRCRFAKDLNESKRPIGKRLEVYTVNSTDFLEDEVAQWARRWQDQGPEVSLGYRFLANVTPLGADGQILDFSELAQRSRGIKRYGVLRMDVDSLGKIFHQGLERPTISRLSTMSFQLKLFFEGWLDQLPERNPDWNNRLYSIYSGGDDLFFVGSWDAAVELAQAIRQDFKDFTRNPKITLSGGVALIPEKYPLYQAAREAGEAEERAKKLRPAKNAFTFLDQPVEWERFDTLVEIQQMLIDLMERSERPVSRGLIQRLYSAYQLHKQEPERKRWLIRLLYSISRLREAHRDHDEALWKLFERICKEELIGVLAVPVRWAQLRLMKEEAQEGGS